MAEAEQYLRTHVQRCHAAGSKAIFYIGPVQVFAGNEIFSKAHPEWRRIRPSGEPDPTPNFANIRSAYADWLREQLAYVTREFKVDGFWFDGYAPAHLHTYDEDTQKAFREYSSGHDIPLPLDDSPDRSYYFDPVHSPLVREYLAWREDYFVKFADSLRETIRQENPEAIIYVNHSANRTWYYPNSYMGEYPLHYTSGVDVASVELYWDVPGDPLYQQFVYAFMQGITPKGVPRFGYSPRHTAYQVFLRRSKSNSVDWNACPGAYCRSSSNRPAARSTIDCICKTSRNAKSGCASPKRSAMSVS